MGLPVNVRTDRRQHADPWLPKVILGATVVAMAVALAGFFVVDGPSSQGPEYNQAQLDS